MLKRLPGAEGVHTPAEIDLRTVVAAFVAFVAVWTLYFAISNYGAAIHNDMAEAYVWGQEFQLGYHQHPPLWAWICGAWFFVFPRDNWSFALLTSLNAALGLLGSWRLIGCFVSGDRRIAATMLLLLTPFYTFSSWVYNANSIFLSIWPWTLYAFVRAIDGGKRRDAVLFGVFMGCALLSKYYAAILALTCLLAALQHPARARYFRSASPYISIAVAAALLTPHLFWLAANKAPPLQYLSSISGRDFSFAAGHAVFSLLGAIAENALPVVIVVTVERATLRQAVKALPERANNPRFRVMATLALAPLILTVIAALVDGTKIAPAMMMGGFSLLPLLAIEVFQRSDGARLKMVAVRASGALLLGAVLASPVIAAILAWTSKDTYELEPRQELAAAASDFWRAKTTAPLTYVAGGRRYDEQLAFYAPGRPHDYIDLDVALSLWIDPRDVAKRGLLVVCVRDDAVCRDRTRALATPETGETEITLAHHAWGHVAPPVSFVVTVIPPQGG